MSDIWNTTGASSGGVLSSDDSSASTTMPTFQDSILLAKEKLLNLAGQMGPEKTITARSSREYYTSAHS